MKAKRILSALLAGLMVAGMSVSAFANETGTKTDDSTPPAQETPKEAPEGDYSVMPLGTPDGTAPVLKSVAIDKANVKPGETITLTINATDDVSGVEWLYVEFVNQENGRSINESYYVDEPIKNGIISFDIEVNEFEPNGVFELDHVQIRDTSGNRIIYGWEDADLPNEVSFTIMNENIEDEKAPILHEVSVNKKEVHALGLITVNLTVSDDVSGVEWLYVEFVNQENGRSINESYYVDEPIKDGIISFDIEINEFEPNGVFELDHIQIRDTSGNRIIYGWEDVDLPNEVSFAVVNTVDTENGNIVTSTNNSELAEDIDKMEDGGTANIYYGNDATLTEDVFEAVAGTDKKLLLSSDGIQWEFDGKTVEADKAKALDLNVDINVDSDSSSDNAGDIEEALGEKNSIIVNFADNGELPGPAKIRIKMDHVFKEYVGTENLYVYYYDNTTGEFVEVASKLKITADSYLEFTITHNSDFVIMNGAYVKPEDKPEDKPENNTDNKPTWTPSYDDDEDEDVVVLEDDKEKITVEEFENGTVKANRKSASKGQKVTLTVTPDDGYVLKSLTVTNSKGKEVEVTEKNGKYYFEMPSTKVSIDAEFVKASVASVEKTNPETGAGDVANVSVAFTVCSVMCGAVLVSKKR